MAIDWETAIPLWFVDAAFLALFVLAGLHARRLLAKDAPTWDYAGYAAVWALALAWAMDRLGAPALAWVLVVLAAVACAMPMARGVNRIVRKSDA